MGYNLYITRRKNPFENDELPITLAEWQEYVENDSELKIDPINNDWDGELMVLWYGESVVADDSEGLGWFCWQDGQIETKNPDIAHIRKMIKIAAAFNARVVGEEFEEYRINGEIWNEKYIEKPPGFIKRLWAWWADKPLPERKTDWVVTGRWDK
jgi:hypothetical protein